MKIYDPATITSPSLDWPIENIKRFCACIECESQESKSVIFQSRLGDDAVICLPCLKKAVELSAGLLDWCPRQH